MIEATVSSKGQIVLPKIVRDRLNLRAGTKLAIEVRGETLVMKRFDSGFPEWRTMRGMFKDAPGLLQDLAEDRASEIADDDGRTNKDH